MTDIQQGKLPAGICTAQDFTRRPDTRFDPDRETLQPLFVSERPASPHPPRRLPPRATASQLALADAQERDAMPLPLASSSPRLGQPNTQKRLAFRAQDLDTGCRLRTTAPTKQG